LRHLHEWGSLVSRSIEVWQLLERGITARSGVTVTWLLPVERIQGMAGDDEHGVVGGAAKVTSSGARRHLRQG
jgi:hypothetical protein